MAIDYNTADATTADRVLAADGITIDLPANIIADDIIVVIGFVNDSNRYLKAPSGWTEDYIANTNVATIIWKVADGTETGSQFFDIHRISDDVDSTDNALATALRISGLDTTDPFNSVNSASEYSASEDPWTTTANTLTGVGTDSHILVAQHCNASRGLTTADSGLTHLVSNTVGYSTHVYAEESPGTGNAAYSNDMASARAHLDYLIELVPAAAGGLGIPIAAYHYNHSLRS